MRMSYEELDGEGMDLQGLDWEDIGVSRKYARERRKLTYKNYTNKLDSDKWKIRPFDGAIPSSENFYSVHSQDPRFTEGQVTNNSSCITNHLQIHESRHSNSPLVAFASNDQGFRVMDIATQKFTLDTKFKFPMNCTALSPDGRLRVMVGDSNSVIIACAESGGPVQWLSGHRDHGFACAWSEDGWTVATAAQDKSVKIWDAQLASVRGLRFSPVGNGPPVLVAAEEADFVNIVNARTFRHKQTIDVFGEIGGVGFTDDGNELNILCPRTRLYWDDMEPF
ncbi:putative WD repeat-containing protein C2A9.03 like [Verticillium longisporum]|uniref:Putative WD repeat-containing protein C2A9.03 like n=1 Tax=Verticillium longisporum TaxID=100787 RepID=A0A8I2ZCX7_VERLO|nr:putative WD repeat-containing protein C2A9.03 like [Verticillium longisporum]